jgi:hypothetical protein
MEKEPSRPKFVQNFPQKVSPAGATPKANAKVWGWHFWHFWHFETLRAFDCKTERVSSRSVEDSIIRQLVFAWLK